LFRKLGCDEALFREGDISQTAVHRQEPVAGNLFAAMFVVADRPWNPQQPEISATH